MPPPPITASLLVIMQWVMVGDEELPQRMPPPFWGAEPWVIVNPSRVELLPVAKVTTLPFWPPSITVKPAPFCEIRVMALLPRNRIFSK